MSELFEVQALDLSGNKIHNKPCNDNTSDRIQEQNKTDVHPSKIVELRTDSIRGYGGNGRRHCFDIDENKVMEITESISAVGRILQPCIVRKDPDSIAEFEMIAGHHRKEAAINAGLETIPCLVMECNDIEANAIMAITNVQRGDLSVMQRAYMLKYQYDLKKSRAKKQKNGSHSIDEVSYTDDVSNTTKYRLMKLTELIEPFQEMIEARKLSKSQGIALAHICDTYQSYIYETMNDMCDDFALSISQAMELKTSYESGALDTDVIDRILFEIQPEKKQRFRLNAETTAVIPEKFDTDIKKNTLIMSLLKYYMKHQEEIDEELDIEYKEESEDI